MTDYPFEQIIAADASNPQIVASNGVVTIFAPGDATKTPLVLKTLAGLPLPNPITVNKLGMGPAYLAPLWQVAWEGGGLSGLFTSNIGLRDEAVAAVGAAQDAQAAAEGAAATAGTEAAAAASAALAGAVADADSAATAAADSASSAASAAALVNAPADTAVQTLINSTGSATRGALNSAYAAKSVETSKLDASEKGAASGVAALGSDSKLLEANVPARLTDGQLSATYAPKNAVEKIDPAGAHTAATFAVRLDANGDVDAFVLNGVDL